MMTAVVAYLLPLVVGSAMFWVTVGWWVRALDRRDGMDALRPDRLDVADSDAEVEALWLGVRQPTRRHAAQDDPTLDKEPEQ